MAAPTNTSQLAQLIYGALASADFDQVTADLGARLMATPWLEERLKLLQSLDRFLAKANRLAPQQFPVGLQAVKLCERDPRRISIWIYNNGPNAIFIGHRQVSTADSWPIANQGSAALGSIVGEIWAIAALAGPSDIRVLDLSG